MILKVLSVLIGVAGAGSIVGSTYEEAAVRDIAIAAGCGIVFIGISLCLWKASEMDFSIRLSVHEARAWRKSLAFLSWLSGQIGDYSRKGLRIIRIGFGFLEGTKRRPSFGTAIGATRFLRHRSTARRA